MIKSIFKRSIIGVMSLALASPALSAVGWPPCIKSFFIGADAEYLRPQNGDLDYVTFTTTNPVSFKSISTNYKWSGWRVYLGFNVEDNDDYTFSWLHFDRNYTNSEVGSSLSPRWLSSMAGALVMPWNDVSGKITFTLDEAYAVWGHTIRFNNPWSFRYAAGVEFANIFSDMTVVGSFADEIDGYRSKNHIEGWGPRMELDVGYRLPWHLNWFLRTNAALLSGTRKVELVDQEMDADSLFVLHDLDIHTRNVIFPKLGMKVGLGWEYVVKQGIACGSTWLLELGWQADVYIHTIERPDQGFIVSADNTAPLLPTELGGTRVTNFSDQGAFVGLKVSIDWA